MLKIWELIHNVFSRNICSLCSIMFHTSHNSNLSNTPSIKKLYINSLQISIQNSTLLINIFHAQNNWPKASGKNLMPRPLLSLNLRADFHAVAEGENHPAIRIDRCVIHKPMEQLLVEIPRLAMLHKEAAENVIFLFLSFSRLSIRLSRAAYRLAYPSYFCGSRAGQVSG